jgi:hypothetical protein
VTILSSLRLDGETESVVFDGAVDRKIFDEYIEKFLAPNLRPGDIVILDNLSAHKSQKAYDIIKEKQAEMIFLPAYSPDLNTTPTYSMTAIHTMPLAGAERFDDGYLVGMASLGFAASSAIALKSGADTCAKASRR